VPLLAAPPPAVVVPYKFPSLAWIRPPYGLMPFTEGSVALKSQSLVKVPFGVIRNSVPLW
jgi:hypothetical protein